MGIENLAPNGVRTPERPVHNNGRLYNGGHFHAIVDPCNMNRAMKNDLKIYSDCTKHNIKVIPNK
jgi:hypothetical protein